jgi:hypothetical protein
MKARLELDRVTPGLERDIPTVLGHHIGGENFTAPRIDNQVQLAPHPPTRWRILTLVTRVNPKSCAIDQNIQNMKRTFCLLERHPLSLNQILIPSTQLM